MGFRTNRWRIGLRGMHATSTNAGGSTLINIGKPWLLPPRLLNSLLGGHTNPRLHRLFKRMFQIQPLRMRLLMLETAFLLYSDQGSTSLLRAQTGATSPSRDRRSEANSSYERRIRLHRRGESYSSFAETKAYVSASVSAYIPLTDPTAPSQRG